MRNCDFGRAAAARSSARRGTAMLVSMLSLMVLSVVGLSLAANATHAMRLTRMQKNGSAAFNLAESGAERALLWLRQQSIPPTDLNPFNPFSGAVTLADGTYTATIDGDNANNGLELNTRPPSTATMPTTAWS
jgi:Tfp pilus assembly protein PilX